MKFAISYSCGKDSTLALHKMIEQGHQPICLIVMVNDDADRSYFHGADRDMLSEYAKALDIPMILCPSAGEDYHTKLEKGLREAKAMGAEAACFGDIDIEANRRWEEERCRNVGLIPCFPLWQQDRAENVYELLKLGYKCLIKSINTNLLPKSLLGKYLNADTIAAMKNANIDICGENGEYHTLTVDGPIFKQPLNFQIGEVIDFGDYAVADVK